MYRGPWCRLLKFVDAATRQSNILAENFRYKVTTSWLVYFEEATEAMTIFHLCFVPSMHCSNIVIVFSKYTQVGEFHVPIPFCQWTSATTRKYGQCEHIRKLLTMWTKLLVCFFYKRHFIDSHSHIKQIQLTSSSTRPLHIRRHTSISEHYYPYSHRTNL